MKLRKIISTSLAVGLIINNVPISFAGILSEDGRQESFIDNPITVSDILETTNTDIKIEGNTLVNLMDNNNIYRPENRWTVLDGGYLHQSYDASNSEFYLDLIPTNVERYKPNTTYTFIIDVRENNSTKSLYLNSTDQRIITSSISSINVNSIGRTVGTFTTLDDFTDK